MHPGGEARRGREDAELENGGGWLRATPFFRERRSWDLALTGGRRWRIGPLPAIVGVINATPDSFSDGGAHETPAAAARAGLCMLAEGASALDVGGESTRPGSESVPAGEQIRRVVPVIRALRGETDAPLSVDTRSPEVGAAALAAGADILNDVSGFQEPGWEALLSSVTAPLVLVHMRGTPLNMQVRPEYAGGVEAAVKRFFEERLDVLRRWGVGRERVLLDPGIGFGKTVQDNLLLIRNMETFQDLGCPLYIGTSRKSFLGKILDRDVREREAGTLAANAVAVLGGASVLRVHDVAGARDLVLTLGAFRDGWTPAPGKG